MFFVFTYFSSHTVYNIQMSLLPAFLHLSRAAVQLTGQKGNRDLEENTDRTPDLPS